jgi:hypothetical protein
MFFFEKKNQKTFAPSEPGFCSGDGRKPIKVFCGAFFQKSDRFS